MSSKAIATIIFDNSVTTHGDSSIQKNPAHSTLGKLRQTQLICCYGGRGGAICPQLKPLADAVLASPQHEGLRRACGLRRLAQGGDDAK
jgi:hypothetical protein